MWASPVSGSKGSHGVELKPQASRQKEGRRTASPRREPVEGGPAPRARQLGRPPGPARQQNPLAEAVLIQARVSSHSRCRQTDGHKTRSTY